MAYINVDEVYILDNTGLQVDKTTDLPFKDAGLSETEKAQARANIGAGSTNPNLLDNPWFTVNQRGLTSGTSNEYPADRWVATYGSGGMTWVRNADGSITATPTNTSNHADIYQVLDQSLVTWLSEKIVTVSVLLADGSILSGTNMFPATGNRTFVSETVGSGQVDIYWSYANRFFRVQNYYAGTPIRAVKLELGSVSTLANDAPPEYDELDHCKWYFERIKALSGNYAAMGFGYAASATVATIFVPMHAKRGSGYTVSTSGSFRLVYGQTTYTVTAISKYLSVSNNWLILTVTSSGMTAGQPLEFGARGDSAAYIDVNNDL